MIFLKDKSLSSEKIESESRLNVIRVSLLGFRPNKDEINSLLRNATRNKGIPALVYKFDRRPIKVRVPLGAINSKLHLDSPFTADLLWDDFIFLLKELYSEEIEEHERAD